MDGDENDEDFAQWDAEREAKRIAEGKRKSWRPLAERKLDHWLRYRAMQWPSLRYQRLWTLLPILGAAGSIWLLIEVGKDDRQRKELCRQAADGLSFPVAPISRETFERARYLFDKASCNVTHIDPRRLRT